MDERVGYEGSFNDYDEYDDDAAEEELEDDGSGGEDDQLEPYQDAEADLDYADDADAGGFQEQDRVEHQLDHANDDGRQASFDERFDEWRKRVRAGRKGPFVPLDTRGYQGPVFVRVKDLQPSPPDRPEPEPDVP